MARELPEAGHTMGIPGMLTLVRVREWCAAAGAQVAAPVWPRALRKSGFQGRRWHRVS